MEKDNNKKLQDQVDKLEKLVAVLASRLSKVEAQNRRLESKVIQARVTLDNTRQDLQRVQRRG